MIELVIVITVIGILASAIFLDFRHAKQRQEVALMADQTLAMMQQTQAEVRSGKVDEEGEFICEGAFFEVGKTPNLAKGLFNRNCLDWQKLPYGFTTAGAYVKNIDVGGVDAPKIWAFFIPPDGRITFYDDGGSRFIGETTIIFGHRQDEKAEVELKISHLTGQAALHNDLYE